MRPSQLFVAVIGFCVVFSAIPAAAQTADPWPQTAQRLQSKLRAGQTIYVLDPSSRETEGRLISLSDAGVTIEVAGQERVFPPGDIRRLARRGDSLVNGTLFGATLLGGVYLIGWTTGGCAEAFGAGRCAAVIVTMAAVGAGIGAAVDAVIRGRTVLYEAPGRRVTVQPLATPSAAGLRVSIAF